MSNNSQPPSNIPHCLNNFLNGPPDPADKFSPATLQCYTIRIDRLDGERAVMTKRIALWLCAQSGEKGNPSRSTFADLGQLSYDRLRSRAHVHENESIVYNVPPDHVVIQDDEDLMTAVQDLIASTTSTKDDLVLRLVQRTGTHPGTLIPLDPSRANGKDASPFQPVILASKRPLSRSLENQELLDAVLLLATDLKNRKRKREPETADTENVHDSKRQTRIDDYIDIVEVSKDGKVRERRLREPVLGQCPSQHPLPFDDIVESAEVVEATVAETSPGELPSITNDQTINSAWSTGVNADLKVGQLRVEHMIETGNETDSTATASVDSSDGLQHGAHSTGEATTISRQVESVLVDLAVAEDHDPLDEPALMDDAISAAESIAAPAADDQKILDDILMGIRADGDM